MAFGCAVLELMGRLMGVSPLGDYASPLQLLIYMTAIKPIARVLVKLPKWAPRLENGRAVQVRSRMPAACSYVMNSETWHYLSAFTHIWQSLCLGPPKVSSSSSSSMSRGQRPSTSLDWGIGSGLQPKSVQAACEISGRVPDLPTPASTPGTVIYEANCT